MRKEPSASSVIVGPIPMMPSVKDPDLSREPWVSGQAVTQGR